MIKGDESRKSPDLEISGEFKLLMSWIGPGGTPVCTPRRRGVKDEGVRC